MPILTDILCHDQKVNLIGNPAARTNTIILTLLHLRYNILMQLSRCLHGVLTQAKAEVYNGVHLYTKSLYT